jgi:hypothetical protein
MKRRETLGTIEFDPRSITKDRGHDYGAGRPAKIHTKPKEKRAKQKLRKEMYNY